MQRPTIVSRDEWTAARKRLLVKESTNAFLTMPSIKVTSFIPQFLEFAFTLLSGQGAIVLPNEHFWQCNPWMPVVYPENRVQGSLSAKQFPGE